VPLREHTRFSIENHIRAQRSCNAIQAEQPGDDGSKSAEH